MKYRLIAGTINRYEPEKGWMNIHMDISPRGIWVGGLRFAVLPEVIGDIANMVDFRNEMFDEVRMNHVIEHLSLDQARLAFRETYRVLKPEGKYDVEVPDMQRVAEAWVNEDYGWEDLQQWIYGEQLPNHEEADSHRYGWWWGKLRVELAGAGFEVGDREETGLALRAIVTKPATEESK